MNNFTKGILVGVGIGLLVAPLSGKETRRLLAERAQEWRDSLPEDSRINQYATQISDSVTSAKENWRDYAQQAISRAKDTSSSVGSIAKQSGQEIAHKAKQTGQEMAYKAKQSSQEIAHKAKQSGQEIAHKARQASQEMAHKAKQTAGIASSSPNGVGTRVIPETEE